MLGTILYYFKKTFPEYWKNYLDLHNKCFKKISDKKGDYIKNIEEYKKMQNSGVKSTEALAEYEKKLKENIEQIDTMIKYCTKRLKKNLASYLK